MTLPKSLWWTGGSLVLMLVGAFGPWAKVLVFTIDGTDDGKDGWIVVGAAAVAAAFLGLFLWRRRRWLLALPLLAGCAGGATAAYDISDINSLASNNELASALVSTEWGIYLALVGSISLVLASIAASVQAKAFDSRRRRGSAKLMLTKGGAW